MSRVDRSAKPDAEVSQVLDVLSSYEQAHPRAMIEGRRQNPVAIRVRIIDPDFEGIDLVDREDEIWPLLQKLPEEVFANLTMLLLLTPEESTHSFASMEFDDPIPSRL
jgi:hypothetical protein